MKKLFILLFFALLLPTSSYANELVFSGETKTIKELNQNIQDLDKEKNNVINKLIEINPSEKLKDFFRTDLLDSEVEDIKNIIEKYNKEKRILEVELINTAKSIENISNIKQELLTKKSELYKNLVKYIKKESISDYLEYIKSDAILFTEKNNINADIVRKKEIVATKVSILEEKIERHNTILQEKVRKIVEDKIDEKIFQIKNNKNFIELNNDSKIKVINKTIYKIEEKIKSINKTERIYNTKDNYWLKIEVYNITIEKLENFIEIIKEQE